MESLILKLTVETYLKQMVYNCMEDGSCKKYVTITRKDQMSVFGGRLSSRKTSETHAFLETVSNLL